MEQVLGNQSRIPPRLTFLKPISAAIADFLSQIFVREVASSQLVSLRGDQTLAEVRTWIAEGGPGSTHHSFPVVDTYPARLDPKVAPETPADMTSTAIQTPTGNKNQY